MLYKLARTTFNNVTIPFKEVTVPTLEQIQAKMKKLQVQADALIAKKAQAAVDQIRKIMLAHGLTTQDIEAKAKAKREAKAANGSASKVKAKAANSLKGETLPKYHHPKTGATWTGHGRAPGWIANVKDRTKFLIATGAEAIVAATVGTASKTKTAVKKASKTVGATGDKGQRKGPQPALYQDPKSGATWSGRGRAPAWLAGVKDRTKFSIGGASAVTDTGAASKPKAVAKKPATKTAATKKAPAKKLVGAKKAVTKVTVVAAPEAAAA
jgi:DNA-binding protein H-NS